MRLKLMLLAVFLILPVHVGAGQEQNANGSPDYVTQREEEAKPRAEPTYTLLLYVENDLFYDTDRYNTSSQQLRFIGPNLNTIDDNEIGPRGLNSVYGALPYPGSADAAQYNISFGIGQQIYTPEDTQVKHLQENDRPYAGYLYGLLALHAKRRHRMDTLELAAGVIGPSSLAKQSQNEVHRIKGVDTAKGWKHQLKDEPAVMLTWSRSWRVNQEASGRGFDWDVLPRMAVSLGTPFTQAGAGTELRLGWNLPADYGTSLIRPGAGIYAPNEEDGPARGSGFWDNTSFYVFAGVEGRGVLHNTFLDGNTWKSSHSVDKRPFVGELSWGLALLLYDFRLVYTHVYRTDEFYGQNKGQNFGSILAGYTF